VWRCRTPSRLGAVADSLLAESDRDATPILVATHSDIFVLRIRQRVRERTLARSQVEFVWVGADGSEELTIPIDQSGDPTEMWPEACSGLGVKFEGAKVPAGTLDHGDAILRHDLGGETWIEAGQ
jgi:hypothetical protein